MLTGTPEHFYAKLSDPRGTIPDNVKIKYPAEPALGGGCFAEELEALIAGFKDSCNIHTGFRANLETTQFEQAFSEFVGSRYAVTFNGAGSAMDQVLKLLKSHERKEEVLTGAMNFHGQHLSILGSGCKPILVNNANHNYSLEIEDLRGKLTRNTLAVIVTSLHGEAPDFEPITQELDAFQHTTGSRIWLIYDAARSLGVTTKINQPHSQKFLSIYSLQSKKIITALGEGGVACTNNEILSTALRHIVSFGSGFSWGSNFKLSKLQAKIAHIQLHRVEGYIKDRQSSAQRRNKMLLPLKNHLDLCDDSVISRHAFHFYPIRLNERFSRKHRDEIIEDLATNYGIGCVVANPPTYLYNNWLWRKMPQRVIEAEKFSSLLLCPSFHHSYGESDERYICQSICSAITRYAPTSY
ncbi:DegT/DnrJ/EryC1/StrS family aminotransferase [Burkholderia plantarii]|uniref:DegT/DnrJ/EryC1/StrS family aminotransferase n=1 Tax=Burkholderia plantarii TaxID=41899 RepID=UPI0009F42544|nr:DegT/DnrJ/EryC1/StrS family aminotransferase [Burkholderia plantarii]